MKEEASAGGSSSTDLRTTLLGERRDSSSDRCARILSSFAPVRVTLRVNMQCVSAADSHVCLVAHEVDLRLQGGCCYNMIKHTLTLWGVYAGRKWRSATASPWR